MWRTIAQKQKNVWEHDGRRQWKKEKRVKGRQYAATAKQEKKGEQMEFKLKIEFEQCQGYF